jgi:hypothetical protein
MPLCKPLGILNHFNDEVRTMAQSSSLRLIDRGRKAGLGTNELYLALRTRPPEAHDQPLGQSDGNGFVVGYSADGHRFYRPVARPQ